VDDQSTAPLQAVENAALFPAVSELSGSFCEHRRLGKEFRIKRFERSEAFERLEHFEQESR
jgi:hypothetical protein